MLRVETVGVKEMARDLLVLGDGRMAKDLQKALLVAARPIVGDVRTAVLATPSKSAHVAVAHSGRNVRASARFGRSKARNKNLAKFEQKASLRETIARAARLNVSAAGGKISIAISADMMPKTQQALPWNLEGAGRHWRHPVFGRWLSNMPDQPSHPYFFKTIESQVPRLDAEVVALMELFAKQAGF
jgi:hypothetical protein